MFQQQGFKSRLLSMLSGALLVMLLSSLLNGLFSLRTQDAKAASAQSQQYLPLVAKSPTTQTVTALASAGSYLYVGADHKLLVLDVQTPSQPVLRATLALTETDTVGDIIAQPPYLYLVLAKNTSYYVQIVDVQQPTAPVLRGRYQGFNGGLGMAVVGSLLYLTNYSQGLSIVDAQNPDKPELRGQLPDVVGSIVVSQQMAYIAGSQLAIVDVADATRPVVRSRLDLPRGATRLNVIDGLAYVTSPDVGQIVDVRDVQRPRISDTYPLMLFPFQTSIANATFSVIGSLARYQGYGRFYTYRRADTGALSLQGSLAFDAQPVSLISLGTTAYIGTYTEGLYIIDIQNPKVPAIINRF